MEKIIGNSVLDQFFDDTTMSFHAKEWRQILTKKWSPWSWKPVLHDQILSKKEMNDLIGAIYKEVEAREDSQMEIDRTLSKVIQMWPYRIVIVYPPLSDGLEMTVVKPIKILTIEDYNLDKDVYDLLRNKAKGILVSWSPWSWKTTFAQALVDVYHKDHNIIKTIESPRDLMVSDDVVQYSFTYGTHDEVRDILLLSRPDYTVYDEVRNKSDFELYKDLRLTGIGLVWVIHATRPVDSIQRFIGTIDMGIIPQVLDTVIYIDKGQVQEIYNLKLTVKVPEWMESDDLARPVIIVTSFMTKRVEYEIYTFGEQIVVMPLWEEGGIWKVESKWKSAISEYAKQTITQKLKALLPSDFLVKIKGNTLDLFVPEFYKWRIIGKSGVNIIALEKSVWLGINIKTFDELPLLDVQTDMNFQGKNAMVIAFPEEYGNKTVCLLVWEELLYFNTDPSWVVVIKNKDLVRNIQKKGYVIVNLEIL